MPDRTAGLSQEDISLWLSRVKLLSTPPIASMDDDEGLNIEKSKIFAVSPIRPVTVHQVLSAKALSYPERVFVLDGSQLDTVLLVALVVNIDDRGRYFVLDVDDGTQGRLMRVFVWKRDVKVNYEAITQRIIEQGKYARIHGRVNRTDRVDRNFVTADNVQPIGPDFHEIFYHQLAVIKAAKFIEEGRKQVRDSQTPEQYATPDTTFEELGAPPSPPSDVESEHTIDADVLAGLKEPTKDAANPKNSNVAAERDGGIGDPSSSSKTQAQVNTTTSRVEPPPTAGPAHRAVDPLAHLTTVERCIMLYVLEQQRANPKGDSAVAGADHLKEINGGVNADADEAKASEWRGVHVRDLAREAGVQHHWLTVHDIVTALDKLSDEGRLKASTDGNYYTVSENF